MCAGSLRGPWHKDRRPFKECRGPGAGQGDYGCHTPFGANSAWRDLLAPPPPERGWRLPRRDVTMANWRLLQRSQRESRFLSTARSCRVGASAQTHRQPGEHPTPGRMGIGGACSHDAGHRVAASFTCVFARTPDKSGGTDPVSPRGRTGPGDVFDFGRLLCYEEWVCRGGPNGGRGREED